MVHKDLNVENLIKIDSVGSYIREIQELRKSSDGASTELYFRGQEAEFWDIEPSSFRNDMLSIEHILMQSPLQKIPMEFKDFTTMFDIMTKYQHYGMCTRLLDLTTNPLVALYFACKNHGLEKYESDEMVVEKEPYGVIYYSDKYYPLLSNAIEVRIISSLAKYDLSKENTVSAVLRKLRLDNIISENEEEQWKKEDYMKNFTKIIQQNYMVMPTYTNERLKRQNGVFLLAGMFSVNYGSDAEHSIITKSKGSLRNDFSNSFFYVRGEDKESILNELDLYSINEATLFPELEHQLNYIRVINQQYAQPVSDFSSNSYENVPERETIYIDDKQLNNYLLQELPNKLKSIIELEDIEPIMGVISKHLVIDWYKRDSTSSQIKMSITNYYTKESTNKQVKAKAVEIASRILSKINDIVKDYLDRKD